MSAAARRLRPLFDRVLLRRKKVTDRNIGGIMVPESNSAGKPNEAVVVAVGPGARNREGVHVQPVVKEGDRVLLGDTFGGVEVQMGEEDLFLVREDDILGILEGE